MKKTILVWLYCPIFFLSHSLMCMQAPTKKLKNYEKTTLASKLIRISRREKKINKMKEKIRLKSVTSFTLQNGSYVMGAFAGLALFTIIILLATKAS